MKLLNRWLAYFVILIVLIIGVFFSFQNDAQVPLDLLVIQLSEQRVSLWILLAFAVGGIIGMLISSLTVVRLRSRSLRLQRKLDKQNKELNALRTADMRSSGAMTQLSKK